jgi:tocopherol cyclase
VKTLWLNKIKYPLLFQGSSKSKEYFEGWYYKQVSKDEKSVISFIPGISMFNNDLHSFLQYIFIKIDENEKKVIKTGYVRYAMEDFKVINNPFMLQVGENIFTENRVSIKVENDTVNLKGTLELGSLTPIERSILTPNIMGYFAYIPKMECYHGIVSMNHSISGVLRINNEDIDFNEGKGYVEKDWGTSFPKKYIWIQCNNFKDKNTSIFCSIALIPFMKSSFLGHISNIMINGEEYRFATYNNSKFKIQSTTNGKIVLLLENSKVKVKIEATLNESGELISPYKGKMQGAVKEGLSGEVKIYLYNVQDEIIYEDIGQMGGIEIVGFS